MAYRNGKHFLMKITAFAAALSIIAVSLHGSDICSADYEDAITSLESRQTELETERLQLEASIKEYSEKADKYAEYLELYDRKMKIQEEEMANVSEQILLLNGRMTELDQRISEKQAAVDEGIEKFRQRLRVLYVSGNDSLAEVIVGSSDFYDMLSRLEIVQRVSKHENDMINDLSDEIKALDADKQELENERAALGNKKAEQEHILKELQNTYANHKETQQWYENQAEAQAERTVEIEKEEQQIEEELQDYIRREQAAIAERMADKKKKLEEERAARKKAEAERKAKAEKKAKAQKKAEEEARKQETEVPLTVENEDIIMSGASEETAAPETESSFFDTESTYTETEAPEESFFIMSEPSSSEDDYDFYDPYSDYQFDHLYDEDSSVSAENSDDEDSLSFDDNGFEYNYEYDGDKGYGTYPDTGFMWPVPTVRNITDGYGNRYIEEESSSSFHKGIDINKPGCEGEAIVASAGGVVMTASDTGNGYGIHVIIDHGDGIATVYAHMESCCVSVGEEVQQGQIIGYIGHTGYAYGNHCHFEVRVNGQHTDPFNYVEMEK